MADTYTPRSLGDADAPHLSPALPSEDARTVLLNQISWGAVLAGVAVALVLNILLNLLGVGMGAATLNPVSGDNPTAASFSIGAAAWWTVAGLLSSLAGGYVAGRLAGKPVESTAGWHGLISWAMTTIVIFYLLTTAVGSIVGGPMPASAAPWAALAVALQPLPRARCRRSRRRPTRSPRSSARCATRRGAMIPPHCATRPSLRCAPR